jgi:hypothetical protein
MARRIVFMPGALVFHRIGTDSPIPGIDPRVLEQLFVWT